MPVGDTAIFSGEATRSQTTVVDWETDYVGSPKVPKKAKFDINERDMPKIVAQNLADDFNSKNGPHFSATATGAEVVFKAEDPKYEVSDMRFTINNEPTNLPGNGPSVPLGNTGVSVKNANG